MREGLRSWTIGSALAWVMKALLVGLLPYLIYTGDYPIALLTCLAIALSMVPSIVERNHRVHLPFELDFLITLAIFLHTVPGEWLEFYERVWLWDKALHFYSSAIIALLAFVSAYTLHYTGKLRLTIPFIGLFTVVFAISIGVLWELMEFFMDIFFGMTMQNGLADTMFDLIYDIAGGCLVAVAGMVYVRFSNPEERRRLTRPLGEVFDYLWGRGGRC